MLNKKELLKQWEEVNLSELGLEKTVWFRGLTDEAKKRIMENYGFETEEEAEDEYYFVGSDVEFSDIEDWNEYAEEWFEPLFDDKMEDLIEGIFGGKYQQFLCHSVRDDWRGSSSYRLYDLDDLKAGDWLPKYDNSTYLIDRLKRGKIAEFRQHHHDVPCGHPVYLIGLTEKECEQIVYWHENYQRSAIKAFAESKIG